MSFMFSRDGPARVIRSLILALNLSQYFLLSYVFSNLLTTRYRALGIKEGKSKWRLFFKIFCFLHPDKIAEDSVEGSFLFEQVSLQILFLAYQF